MFAAVPLEGIKCGYEGNTNDKCASLFHLFSKEGAKLDFDDSVFGGGRHLTETASDTLEVDFAISPEPVIIPSIPDVQNYPIFVYGVAPAFNIPGVTKLVLTREALARIFRGCDYLNTTSAPSTSAPTTSPSVSPTMSPTVALNTHAPSQESTTSIPTSAPTNFTSTGCMPDSITRWDDEAIRASNPTSIHAALTAAGKIKVFVSSDASPTSDAFKHALSRFDPVFRAQIGEVNDDVNWYGTEFESVPGSYGTLRKVANTPGSITFANIHQIRDQLGVVAADLEVDNGEVVNPTTAALYAAFFEVGLDFGNDGSDPSRLTVDLTSASGLRSWPIALLGYASSRKDHTPKNCYMRKLGLLSFVTFYYEGLATQQVLSDTGTAPLTGEAGAQILAMVRRDLKCDGVQVYSPPALPPNVAILVDESLHSLLGTFVRNSGGDKYTAGLYPPTTHVQLRDAWICMTNVTSCYISSDLVVIANENLSEYIIEDQRVSRKYELFSMPYVAIATGFIYNFCKSTSAACDYRYRTPLVLDVITAANILDGNILYWNDSAIAALNPARTLPNERIIVFSGPTYSSYHIDFVQRIRATYLSSFAYKLGKTGGVRNTFLETWMDIALTPFSISFAVLNGTVVEGVEHVTLRNDQGVDVAASPESIEACAYDTYDENAHVFRLSYSTEPDCYPLTTTFTLFSGQSLKKLPPAQLMKVLYDQSLRHAKGRTAAASKGFGTLVDLNIDGISLAKLNLEKLEMITSAYTGESILQVPHALNLIPQSLSNTLYAIMGVEIALFVILAVWTIVHRNRKLIRNSSPLFMLQVLFGAVLMALTVIPLSFQDDNLIPRAVPLEELNSPQPVLDFACVLDPILFSMGFFITFSAIFLKSWRLIRIFNNAKLKNLFLRDRQLMLYQVAVVVFAIVLNALWAGIDPMVWQRYSLYQNSNGLVVGSAGICHSRSGIGPAIPLIIGIVLILVVGNYLAYLGRRIPTEFNESKWTAMAMMMVLEAFIIAVPVLVLSNDQPVPGFIVKSLVCLLVPGGTIGLIFIPKLMLAYGIGENKDDSNPWRFVRPSDSSGGASNSKNNSKVAQQQNAMLSQIVGNSDIQVLSSPALASQMSVKNFPASSNSTSQALARILQDDPSRRKFRRFLKTLKMEENVRFWDAVLITKAEQNENKRYVGTRAVIQSFVCDNSPFQVNLSSATKQAIIQAYDSDDKQKLKDPTFFDQAMAEMFDDLKQSDAFRVFIEQDTFSTTNLA